MIFDIFFFVDYLVIIQDIYYSKILIMVLYQKLFFMIM